jgi:hypothetical protein
MTLLRTLAEKSGWQTGSGIDIVAENCVSCGDIRGKTALLKSYMYN